MTGLVMDVPGAKGSTMAPPRPADGMLGSDQAREVSGHAPGSRGLSVGGEAHDLVLVLEAPCP
jgi:hypothetical protein